MFTNRRAVLHVDDDPLITKVVAEHLRTIGCDSEAVHDPLCAMQALIRGHYRIVLLDVHMPQKDGLGLLREIKQYDAGVQVILLTGLVGEATFIDAIRRGASACFFKPLTEPQPLLEAVDEAYRRNEAWWRTLYELTQRSRGAGRGVNVPHDPGGSLQPL